ncbi:NERD domain-containing protein [Salinicoccus sp. ID82-1]|uniref:nuclease-related domain-containing protein n=1 Tax=Salinicoccus sp. ID82-1 TaxID=2820269 RepID=UPI001F281AF3|nr:nuclease-related domain-containing protein [Salinicoccus sp. ID82-1]MCG1010004.1 NERD domain-containing protein [Salinicoccus sp. ID82-1]
MFMTERHESKEQLFYEVLEKRCALHDGEAKRLKILRQGLEGERIYDRLWDEVGHADLMIFRDIWMRIENAVLQIDALVVTDGKLIVNEIKNYSGRYMYEDGTWYVNNFQISEDPLAQLSRTAGKLVRLKYLDQKQFDAEKKVVFVNPDFNLTTSSVEGRKHIVDRSLLKHYLRDIARSHSGQNASELASAIHQYMTEDPMTVPEVETGRIRAGFYCGRCNAFDLELEPFRTRCILCGHLETVEYQTVRAIIDFANLFPEQGITKHNLRWITGGEVGDRRMERYLNKYCTLTRRGKHSAYTIDTLDLGELLKMKSYTSRYEKDKSILAD